jgi:hypothetical protein
VSKLKCSHFLGTKGTKRGANKKNRKETNMSNEELTKEEFMVACKADGTEESVCEARWTAAHSANPNVTPAKQSPGDADKDRKIEMLEAQLETRERQLRQAIDIADRANNERKAKEEGERQKLINSIQIDGPFPKTDLEKKSLSELQIMRYTLDKGLQKTFANVAAEIDASKRKKQPFLTAGYYDSETKTWKGGI